MSEFMSDKELQAFEQDLKSLVPAAATIDRDGLLFHAGQQSFRRQRRLWMLSTATLFVCLVAVSAALLWHLQTDPPERIRYVIIEAKQPAEIGKAPEGVPAPPRIKQLARDESA